MKDRRDFQNIAHVQNFNITFFSPDQVWVSDINYLKVKSKWDYLTVFIDLFSWIIVGRDLSASLESHSLIRALYQRLFQTVLHKQKFVQSASRKGNCWENAVAESFSHRIKTQLSHHYKFQNMAEAEQALLIISEFITIARGSIQRMDISLRQIMNWCGGIIKKWLNLNSQKSLQDQASCNPARVKHLN